MHLDSKMKGLESLALDELRAYFLDRDRTDTPRTQRRQKAVSANHHPPSADPYDLTALLIFNPTTSTQQPRVRRMYCLAALSHVTSRDRGGAG